MDAETINSIFLRISNKVSAGSPCCHYEILHRFVRFFSSCNRTRVFPSRKTLVCCVLERHPRTDSPTSLNRCEQEPISEKPKHLTPLPQQATLAKSRQHLEEQSSPAFSQRPIRVIRETDTDDGTASLTPAKCSMSSHVPTSLHVGQASKSHASPANRPSWQVQLPVASLQTPPAEHGTESPVRSPAVASSNHATPLSQSFGSPKATKSSNNVGRVGR